MQPFALIWDLDGTLVDSYPAIVPAAREVCADCGISYSAEDIYSESLRTSVGAFLEKAAAEHGMEPGLLKSRFNILNDSRIAQIRPMPHAVETLAELRRNGYQSFVFTHRGASCHAILERTGLELYFTEIVTALSGFPRKPAPDGIAYLMQKYALDAARCFYIGDRSLDMEAARNAGIQSILYRPADSPVESRGKETYIVHDLLEITALQEFRGERIS